MAHTTPSAKNPMPAQNTDSITITAWIQNSERLERIKKWSQRFHYDFHFFDDFNKAEDFLNYENSPILIFDLSPEIEKTISALNQIFMDPWLHGTIVFGITESYSQDLYEKLSPIGLIDLIEDQEINTKFSMILETMAYNLFLFTRSQIALSQDSVLRRSFKIHNNLRHSHYAVNYMMMQCYSMGFRDRKLISRISLSLTELLYNAIEHGNCGITHAEKSELLANNQSMEEIIHQRANLPTVKNKFVHIAMHINRKLARFYIRDEGDGFDLKAVPNPNDESNMMKLHGRGILVARHSAEGLVYNAKGNGVMITFVNENPLANISFFPIDLQQMKRLEMHEGEILFAEKSPSDNFYFIISGTLGIYVNHKIVAKATSEDLFIGEMSFLLNNRRTAMVKALTHCSLIPISRKEFVNVVKKFPFFAVFLSRILAERLAEQNEKISLHYISV